MAERYTYGKRVAEVTDASGIRGFILRDIDGSFFFRIYHENKDFTDYELLHDDLEVVIAPDALAAFYKLKDRMILDHSPEVLGLKKAQATHKIDQPLAPRRQLCNKDRKGS